MKKFSDMKVNNWKQEYAHRQLWALTILSASLLLALIQ